MQESSIWGVHQTHFATRDDDGRGGKRDQTESQEAGENTRAHTLSHTNSLGTRGQAHGGGARRLLRIAVVLHKSQQRRSACRAGTNIDKSRRQRAAEGERVRENLASLHEAHRLSFSARAKHSWQRSSWSAGNSTDAKGSEDRMMSPGENARSATTHTPRPGLRVVATWNRSLRYRSRASCRCGERARTSGAPLALIGLPPVPQSSASSRAAAARRAIAEERHSAGRFSRFPENELLPKLFPANGFFSFK
jgi:hypothetical protein